jgi:hypothetical protein
MKPKRQQYRKKCWYENMLLSDTLRALLAVSIDSEPGEEGRLKITRLGENLPGRRGGIVSSIGLMLMILTACAPTSAPKDTAAMNASDPPLPLPLKDIRDDIRAAEYGAKPDLVDPANGIYRFSNGVCRRLDQVTAPWTVRKFENSQSPDNLGVYYQAMSADFGIAVPELPDWARRTINYQDPAYLYVSISEPAVDVGGADERFYGKILANPGAWGQRIAIDVPVSPSFLAYQDNTSEVILLNQALQTAVSCPFGIDASDATDRCKAYVLLNKQEMAIFSVNYAGFRKLEEVSRSIRELAAALRVDCPKK